MNEQLKELTEALKYQYRKIEIDNSLYSMQDFTIVEGRITVKSSTYNNKQNK